MFAAFFTVVEAQYVMNKMVSDQKKVIEQQNIELINQKEEILKQKEEIESQRDLAREQYQIISEQKKHITDSIVYASTIQRALLPESVDFLSEFEYFIFFRPKEIVSGDFYWFHEKGNRIIVAAVDCTGHGVPGAFMSLLGMTFLNDIMVKAKNDIMPSEILEQLRDRIINTFHKVEGEEKKDGMEMALYILEPDRKTLHFAGANNPLYIVRETVKDNFPQESDKVKLVKDSAYTLVQIKADKMPIGRFQQIKPFTHQTINLLEGDSLYIFSDGILDQFGGPHDKRFGSARFKKLLLSIQYLSMQEQKLFLKQTIDDWMQMNPDVDNEQLDDMLVVGLRMPRGTESK